jgi:hypothetical protein
MFNCKFKELKNSVGRTIIVLDGEFDTFDQDCFLMWFQNKLIHIENNNKKEKGSASVR